MNLIKIYINTKYSLFSFDEADPGLRTWSAVATSIRVFACPSNTQSHRLTAELSTGDPVTRMMTHRLVVDA